MNRRAASGTSVLLVSWDYGTSGGLGRAMEWIADHLKEEGVSVDILSPFAPVAALSVTRFAGGHMLFSLLLPFLLPFVLRRRRVTDIILPVGPGGVFLLAWPRRCKVHAIADHLYAAQSRMVPGERWKRVFMPLERRMLHRADSISCVSPDTRELLQTEYGLSADVLIPFAFDAAAETPKEAGLCVCVARLIPRKGIPVLLKAWQKVHARFPAARLSLVGDGPGRRLLTALPKDVRASIDWQSHMTYDDLLTLWDRSAIAITTSYLEGFSLASVAAMSRGCAAVVSDAPGLRFFLEPEQNGLRVAAGDADAFADAILRLLRDPDAARRLGNAARGTVSSRFGSMQARDALRRTLLSHLTQQGS
ncbi:MAG TPA: glycosyltransferase family 4 protein [Candidatus Peribacteraceae bacterium]|nr:glycosyltransferase family 4 protein [Candidatus Peribacteraceae bacterium]